MVAVGASGSGIAGLTVWTTDGGKIIWAILTVISTVIAVIKPILKLSDGIAHYGKLYGDYANIYYKVKAIEEDIRASDDITLDNWSSYSEIRTRTAELQGADDPKPDRKLVIAFQDEVKREIPVEKLWMPFE